MATYPLTPIGEVRSDRGAFEIALEPRYARALDGLDGFSHAIVLWWAHGADGSSERGTLVCRRPYRNSVDDVGVFASRSPARPNPMGLSVVSLAHVDPAAAVLTVPFIDAEPGTPVLDVKPYFPASDRVRDVRTPGWCRHWPQWQEDSATFDWAGEFN